MKKQTVKSLKLDLDRLRSLVADDEKKVWGGKGSGASDGDDAAQ